VPCSADFENDLPALVTAQMTVEDEFESRVSGNSASVQFACWYNSELNEINPSVFGPGVGNPSTFLRTRVRPASGLRCTNAFDLCGTTLGCGICTDDDDCGGNPGENTLCRPQAGLLGVVEEFHSSTNGAEGTDAFNVHFSEQNRGRCFDSATNTYGDPCTVATESSDCAGGQFCAADQIVPATP
jgi:hypothetical protein